MNSRLLKDASYTSSDAFRTDEKKFFDYLRMSRSSFDELKELRRQNKFL